MRFVRLVVCVSLWSLTSSHHNFPHLVCFFKLCFQMLVLTASILADKKPLRGNEILTTSWIIRCISQIALPLITAYLSLTVYFSEYEWVYKLHGSVIFWCCMCFIWGTMDARSLSLSQISEILQQPFQLVSLLFWVAAHSFPLLFD